VIGAFDWGDLRLTLLDGGVLWLDGGAMFGIVPKPLWEKLRAPDDQNRIRLAMNVLLIDDGERRTLVDTGAGTRWNEKWKRIFGLEPKSAEELLAPAGLAPGDVDCVINTHLHFDHAGGNTTERDGRIEPAFPDAEYVVQRGELDTARWKNERTRGSYVADRFEPLVDEGRLRLVDGPADLGRGVSVEPAPGHTPHMQIVHVQNAAGTLAFLADLVPTSSHLPLPYIMGYDLEPLRTLATKKDVLGRAVAEEWTVVFEHDDRLPLATLVEDGGRVEARPAAALQG
jgi:glyoxylase-like metal-dependent hydrolase (beta-lactamase superfamily II)